MASCCYRRLCEQVKRALVVPTKIIQICTSASSSGSEQTDSAGAWQTVCLITGQRGAELTLVEPGVSRNLTPTPNLTSLEPWNMRSSEVLQAQVEL